LTARVECGASIYAIFLLTVRRIRMFFSLKPSLSQGESSLKILVEGVRRFGGVKEQTNKQTDSLTDKCFYRVIMGSTYEELLARTLLAVISDFLISNFLIPFFHINITSILHFLWQILLNI